MAQSETTYRSAQEYQLQLCKYLKENVTNCHGKRWITPTGSGPFSIANTKAEKQSQITAFNALWTAGISSPWNFTKHASNPLVAKAYNNDLNHEYYPTCIVKVGSDYRCMAKNNNEGWGYSSSDGVVWTEDGKYLTKGTAGQWDDGKSSPGCMRYIGSTFHLCYNGYDDVAQLHYVGYASANSWGAFTKSAGIQYGATDYNTANGTSFTHAIITDVLLIGTTYYYFGIVCTSSYNDAVFCYGVGTPGGNFYDYKLNTKILAVTEYGYVWGQYPNVFKHPDTGEYIMSCTLGRLVQDATQDNQAIYNIYSDRTDLPVFDNATLDPNPLLKPDVSKSHEDNYNYCPSWFKNNDGTLIQVSSKYRLYFSSHEAGASYDYTGAMCLAEISTIPQI